MSLQVAIPVYRVRCRIWTDESREWSFIHEALMLALAQVPSTMEKISNEHSLPKQVVVAAMARLMQHRLVEIVLADDAVAFGASDIGLEMVRNGRPLPRFPREVARWYGVVVERFSGCCFLTRDVGRLAYPRDLAGRRSSGEIIKVIDVETKASGVSHEISIDTLTEIVERGGHRRLLRLDGSTVSIWDQLMLVSVLDGGPKLPSSAPQGLRDMITDAATSLANRIEVTAVPGSRELRDGLNFEPVVCNFAATDIVVGGSAHRDLIRGIIGAADTRVVIHSTFLDLDKFRGLVDVIRTACARGVQFDLLWGEEADDPATSQNAASALAIAREIAADFAMRGLVRMRMGTTGSHAKIILADQIDAGWCAVLGSCNWMSSPFRMVEASVILRHPIAVADIMTVVQRTVGRRPLADDLANELAIKANKLRQTPFDANVPTNATVTLLIGGAHEALMRRASGEAAGRFFVGTHRMGANIRPATLLPAGLAAARGAEVAVLYTQPNKPMTRQEAKTIATEALLNDVRVVEARKIPAHAKVLIWSPDNVAVTSQNWGSASTNLTFPLAEIGVHVQAPGLADQVLAKFDAIYPKVREVGDESL